MSNKGKSLIQNVIKWPFLHNSLDNSSVRKKNDQQNKTISLRLQNEIEFVFTSFFCCCFAHCKCTIQLNYCITVLIHLNGEFFFGALATLAHTHTQLMHLKEFKIPDNDFGVLRQL